MNEAAFWTLIETARATGGPDADLLPVLSDLLLELPPDEIAGFDARLDDCLARAAKRELWAAAYLINAGCSEEGFEAFCGWLVAQGRETFERALRDPASLANAIVMDPEWEAELEDLLYVARQAYEEKTRRRLPPNVSRDLASLECDEDTLERMYPALAQRSLERFEPLIDPD